MFIQFQPQQVTSGSGFVVRRDGYILTNSHVVDSNDSEYTVVMYDGSQKKGTVVYRDQGHDVAVVKVDGTFDSVASLGDSSLLKSGQPIASIGNAYGRFSNSVSLGTISNVNRTIVAEGEGTAEKLNGIVQSNATIAPGYSGGPVIDINGNVIGMNVAKGNHSSFLIPINTIKTIVSDYI
jgi:S1-C subfamily serine protease